MITLKCVTTSLTFLATPTPRGMSGTPNLAPLPSPLLRMILPSWNYPEPPKIRCRIGLISSPLNWLTWPICSLKPRTYPDPCLAGSRPPPSSPSKVLHGVPGNYDTHTNQITATRSFTFTSNGLPHPLSDATLRGLVSRDNYRGRYRFQLGHFTPGRSQNSPQFEDVPLTMQQASPFGIYFFNSAMLRVLTRDGINPKRRSSGGKSSILKVHRSDQPRPVPQSTPQGH